MSQLGPIEIPFADAAQIDRNPFFAPNAEIVAQLEDFMDALRKSGDSVGARIDVAASGVPPVSYTHLDVYKRQTRSTASTPCGRLRRRRSNPSLLLQRPLRVSAQQLR